MNEVFLAGVELMGENLRDKLKFCGDGVRLHPLCKVLHAANAILEEGCRLCDFVFIDAGKYLRIGKYSTLAWQAIIEGGAKTDIGHRAFLGPGSKLLTSTYALDEYFSCEHLPGDVKSTIYGDIILEDDAYVGANGILLPGTIMRQGAVLGAGSVAKGELKAWTVYFGNPCRPIRKRIPPTEERQKIIQAMEW